MWGSGRRMANLEFGDRHGSAIDRPRVGSPLYRRGVSEVHVVVTRAWRSEAMCIGFLYVIR